VTRRREKGGRRLLGLVLLLVVVVVVELNSIHVKTTAGLEFNLYICKT
jgi:hypothetical protein